MKKLLVMAALATLVATSAIAASGVITGSGHDLAGLSNNTDELCVYCHTPHGGSADAPLWNRGVADMTLYTAYTSATLQAAPNLTVGDAQLCMTCHDGDMSDALTNPPAGGNPNFLGVPGSELLGVGVNIGGDAEGLSNDHPVGFVYDNALVLADGELVVETDADVAALLFGGEVWCSSCHDVHKPGDVTTSDAPFLRVSNAGSALCLTCHAK